MRVLPFILAPVVLLFSFAWLETQRLANEYRVHALVTEIRKVQAEIATLQSKSHELARMERIELQAPALDLREPQPRQIVVLEQEVIARFRPDAGRSVQARSQQTRTVVFDLRPIAVAAASTEEPPEPANRSDTEAKP